MVVGVCKKLRNCDTEGFVLETVGNSEANTVCGHKKECTCAGGTAAEGTACDEHGAAKCVACTADGHYLKDHACVDHTDCDAKGLQVKTAGTSTDDAVCGEKKQCTCVGGTAAEGTACDEHDSAKCVACTADGHYLKEHACVEHTDCDAQGLQLKTAGTSEDDAVCGEKKQCSCENGNGAEGTNCIAHGNAKCVECTTDGYFLSNGRCNKHKDCDALGKVQDAAGTSLKDAECGNDKKCACDNGAGAVGTACPADGEAKCVSCESSYGFKQADASCEKCSSPLYNSKNDDSPCGKHTSCKKNQAFKYSETSGEDVCEDCPAGYHQDEDDHYHATCDSTCCLSQDL